MEIFFLSYSVFSTGTIQTRHYQLKWHIFSFSYEVKKLCMTNNAYNKKRQIKKWQFSVFEKKKSLLLVESKVTPIFLENLQICAKHKGALETGHGKKMGRTQ